MKYCSAATDTPKLGKDLKSPCHIKKQARIGANVTLMPGVTVGQNSEIGACSQVRHDVPDNEVWFGTPAKYFKKVE
jgi:acetyltransferase-like isoleucine patch superfamily enzyme